MTKYEVTEEILRSKKYSAVDKEVIERLSAEIIPKYKKQKDVIKTVKKELHIINESFFTDECHAKANTIINTYSGDNIENDREVSKELMALHASTKERLEQIDEIYGFLSGYISADDNITDIGCGFNPFALPFLSHKPKNYAAYDICNMTIQVLNNYFRTANPAYTAQINDAATKTPAINTDVLFIFKLFPLLERQKKGRAFEILNSMDYNNAVISFPLKSASGKEKGMEAFYSAAFEKNIPPALTIKEKAIFKNEMFYVVNKI